VSYSVENVFRIEFWIVFVSLLDLKKKKKNLSAVEINYTICKIANLR